MRRAWNRLGWIDLYQADFRGRERIHDCGKLKRWNYEARKQCEFFTEQSNPGMELRGKLKCGVEMWRGGLGAAYRLPTFSVVGASLSGPCSVSTSRSSNRTGAFNASGSRRKFHDVAHGKVVRPLSKTDEAHHLVQGGFRKPLGHLPPHFMLGPQPLT